MEVTINCFRLVFFIDIFFNGHQTLFQMSRFWLGFRFALSICSNPDAVLVTRRKDTVCEYVRVRERMLLWDTDLTRNLWRAEEAENTWRDFFYPTATGWFVTLLLIALLNKRTPFLKGVEDKCWISNATLPRRHTLHRQALGASLLSRFVNHIGLICAEAVLCN